MLEFIQSISTLNTPLFKKKKEEKSTISSLLSTNREDLGFAVDC